MKDPTTTDRIVSGAQSFQEMLLAAESSDPIFAKALLGSVTSPTKTQGGALIAGVLTYISGHYGFGWSADTIGVVSGAITIAVGYIIHWWQIWMYRKTLPQPPQALPPLPSLTDYKTHTTTPVTSVHLSPPLKPHP